MVKLTGTARNDAFALKATALASTQIRGGAGYDTLAISGTGDITISSSLTSLWRELESLDFSAYAGNVNLTIPSTLLTSSASGAMDIITAASVVMVLAAPVGAATPVNLYGLGHVELSNMTNNMVAIQSQSVSVHGGSGADQITASTVGSILDGGAGNDTLIGNSGADRFVHMAGSGIDLFKSFNSGADMIALSSTNIDSFWNLKNLMADTASGVQVRFADSSGITIQGVTKAAFTADTFTIDGKTSPELGSTIIIKPGTSAAEVNAVIAAAADGTTVVFAKGTHTFTTAINVTRDHITLKGESETGTIFKFDLAAGIEGNFINVNGGAKSYAATVTDAVSAGSNTINVSQANTLKVGDAIYVYQPNTQDYLNANGWTNVTMAEAAGRPFREFVTHITAVDGSKVTVADALPYDFAATETRVFTTDLFSSLTLKDFTVTSAFAAGNPFTFTNTQVAYDGASAVSVTGTDGLHLSGLTVLNSPSTAIHLGASINANISNIHIDGSLNKGGEGNGYGIELSEAFNNHLSALEIFNMRHSVIFSAWSAETGNTVQVTSTNRDINFHGSPDVGNTVVVDHSVMDYDPLQDASSWSIVSKGGTNHAATNIFGSNHTTFSYAEGSNAVDTIYGTDGGDYLNGHGSNDVIFGGNGDDVIVGGLRRDSMTGGQGADTFILKMADDLDTIKDFTFGAGGDHLIFIGNTAVTSTANLVLTQVGSSLQIRYGANSTVILENHTAADVTAANFFFDPLGTKYNSEWMGLGG
jgi:RTX calcium-binding nonapeptide repeat (4 copies)